MPGDNLYIGSQGPDGLNQTQLEALQTELPPGTIPGSSQPVIPDSSSQAEQAILIPSFGNTPVLVLPKKNEKPSMTDSSDLSALSSGDAFITQKSALSLIQTIPGLDAKEVQKGATDPLTVFKDLLTDPSAPVNATLFAMAQKGVSQAKEMLELFNSSIKESMPSAPLKMAYVNFLKHIGSILDEMTQTLYQLEMVNSETSRGAALVQMDAAKTQFDDQKAQIDKQRQQAVNAQKAKQKDVWGWIGFAFSMLFQIITAVVLTIFVPVLGAMAAAVLIMNVIDSIMKEAGATKGVWTAMFDAIKENVKDPTLRQILTICVTGFLLSALTFSGGILLGGGDAFTNILLASGLVPDDIKSKVMLALTIVFAVMTIITCVVMIFVPGAQAAAIARLTKVIDTLSKVSKTLASAANAVKTALTSTSTSMKIVKYGTEFVVTGASIAATTAETVKKAKLYDTMSRLATEMGQLDSDIEQIKALIALLKKIIESLGQENSDISKQIGQLQHLQQAKHAGLSNEMEKLYTG